MSEDAFLYISDDKLFYNLCTVECWGFNIGDAVVAITHCTI